MGKVDGPYSPLKVFHHQSRLDALRDGRQPSPTHIEIVVSNLCQQDCNFCAYRVSGNPSNQLFGLGAPMAAFGHNNPKQMLTYEKVVEVLDDCVELGIRAVQFTGGGEPTVHPRHHDLFHETLSRGLDLALVTNGVLLKDETIETLMGAKWVRISIDAGEASTYASVRRVSAMQFDRAWNRVAQFRRQRDRAGSGPIIGVGFVVTRDNWQEVREAARRAREAGADNLRVSACFQEDGAEYFSEFYKEAAYLVRCAADDFNGGGFKVVNNFGERVEDLRQQSPDYSFCGVQHFTIYLGADGFLYRCCVLSYNERGKIGSISDRRLRDLWLSQEKQDNYAQFDARGCPACMFNSKNRTILYAIEKKPEHVNFV